MSDPFELTSPGAEPGDSANTPLSVGALTDWVSDLLEESIGEVWVAGEISNLRTPDSGHVYFTLKDEGATLAAVMFRGDAWRNRIRLADGQAVVVRGAITVYRARGQHQIQVTQIRGRGQGTLQERFEAMKQRLSAEGLFDADRKRDLPVFPLVVGIVTSSQAAALQDFLQIIQRRAPGLTVRVRSCRVQGEGAAEEIARAIGEFNRNPSASSLPGGTGHYADQPPPVELIVVARGGGSIEDLWAFNEEVVARAIAASDLPVVSGVGHETDFTIADFVADLRAPTPSAAAELITRDWSEWHDEVHELNRRLGRALRVRVESARARLDRLAGSYALREPARVVRQMQQRVDDLSESLRGGLVSALRNRRHQWEQLQWRWQGVDPRGRLERLRHDLSHAAEQLEVLSPRATLARGYAIIHDADGRVVKESDPSLVNQPIRVRLAQGSLDATVTDAKAGE